MEKTTYLLNREGRPQETVCLDKTFYLRYRHKKHTAEFALYTYLEWRLSGEEKTVSVDIDMFVHETGYSRASVYRALNSLIEDGLVREWGLNRKRYLTIVHETPSQTETLSQNETNSANSLNTNDLSENDRSQTDHLYEEFTTSISTERSECDDTLRNDSNCDDTNRNDTIRNEYNIRNDTLYEDLYREIGFSEPPLFELPEKVEMSKQERKIQEEIKKVEYGFSSNPRLLKKHLKPLLKRLEALRRREERKKVSGYRSKDYGPSRGITSDFSTVEAGHEFIRYYMSNVYRRKNISFYIPKSNYGKYLSRARAVLAEIGSSDKAQLYVDWFLRQESFRKSSYNLDLLVSSAVLNQFMNAPQKETRVGISRGIVSSDEERREASKNAKRF